MDTSISVPRAAYLRMLLFFILLEGEFFGSIQAYVAEVN
jgi:hypothetical protein